MAERLNKPRIRFFVVQPKTPADENRDGNLGEVANIAVTQSEWNVNDLENRSETQRCATEFPELVPSIRA